MGERLKLCIQVNDCSPAGVKERYCSSSVAYGLLHMIIDERRGGGEEEGRESEREKEKRGEKEEGEEEAERHIAVQTDAHTHIY